MTTTRYRCAYGDDQPARLYLVGPRCAEHTPAREHGRPEPPPLAGRPWWIGADGQPIPLSPLSTSWVQDTRAVTSGRRVSGERRRAVHAGEAYEGAAA